ncbi:hypothetical protein SprV_0501978500 [Sparganum proliferum]
MGIQRCMDLFADDCNNFGFVLNTEETVILDQTQPDDEVAHQISVKGAKLEVLDNFSYLGSTLSRISNVDDEVARQISTFSLPFGGMQNTF